MDEQKKETVATTSKLSIADTTIFNLLSVYNCRFLVELEVKPTVEGIELFVISSKSLKEE